MLNHGVSLLWILAIKPRLADVLGKSINILSKMMLFALLMGMA
jgi:hypothetical protein